MVRFLIAVKSGDLGNLISAYNFTIAALKNSNVVITMIFFYQGGSSILLNTDISSKWSQLLETHSLEATVCISSYKKRGINIKLPFKPSSILEFINTCETVDRVIQF
jgi:sulfur relay (sulfurtransferase) complex TusBCD TusD component (DsrE family)